MWLWLAILMLVKEFVTGLKPTIKSAMASVVAQHTSWEQIVQAASRAESNSAHSAAVRVVAPTHTPSTGNGFESRENESTLMPRTWPLGENVRWCLGSLRQLTFFTD
jgi:hypothetical protein